MLSTWGVSDRYFIYAGGLMSPMQRCFSDLVCHPLVTSYVIDAYLCLAMLHAWTLEYQHIMLCVWWWIPIYVRRQKGQLKKTAGSPSQRLAQQDSGGCQRSTAIYRCGDLRSPGVTERIDGNSDFFTWRRRWWWWWWWRMTDLCQKWRVKLIFQGIYRLPGTGIVECLKSLT